MKICVTGGAGFLGSHLIDHLKKAHEVFSIDNFIGGEIENIPSGVINYPVGTEEFNKVDLLFQMEKPDIVYHCACTAAEGLSVFSPSFITDNTFGNTMGVLSAAIKNKVKRFIYCSSMSRYGKLKTPFTEDMTPAPEDPYAVAKVASENAIKLLAETHGIEYAIAVPHNIIGVRQKYDDPFRNVASIFINRMLLGKSPIIYGDGMQTRSFSFVDDCIYSLLRMIDCPSGEIYNIGPGEDEGVTTIKELAEIIAELVGFKGEFVHMPDRPREVKHAFCSSEKIKKEFGYKTKTSLRDGLKMMVEDIKKKGAKEFKYHLPLEIEEGAPATWAKRTM